MVKQILLSILFFLLFFGILVFDRVVGPHIFFICVLFLVSYYSSLSKMVPIFFFMSLFHDVIYHYSLGFSALCLLPFLIIYPLFFKKYKTQSIFYMLSTFCLSIWFLWFDIAQAPSMMQIAWYGFWTVFFGSVAHFIFRRSQPIMDDGEKRRLQFSV